MPLSERIDRFPEDHIQKLTEPIRSTDDALDSGEESEHNPVLYGRLVSGRGVGIRKN